MIWEKYPETDPDGGSRRNKKQAIDRADGIIAISEATRRDLLNIYPELSSKDIRVIHHGSSYSDSFDEKHARPEWIPGRFVLYVGARESYKNFLSFFDAMESVLSENADLYVVCTGENSFTDAESTHFNRTYKDKALINRFIQKRCTDDELIALYHNAECFVFPSKCEGFGMPILEAFACGCPVALSDIDIFHEVAGEAAVYFDPDDKQSISDAVRHIMDDPDLRAGLIDKGRKRTKIFSWDKAARETYDFYKSVAGLRE